MGCRTTAAHSFKVRLGLKQYNIILAKEESVLTKIKISFEGENENFTKEIHENIAKKILTMI